MSNRFLDLIANRQGPIVADGGMGTMLMAAGLLFGDPPEQWNVLPDKQAHVRAVHRGYLDAGAQIILTNTFGGNPFRLKLHNLQDQVFELNRAAAELARSEAGDRVVAGDIGPSGELFEPMGTLTYDAAVAGFAAQAAGLASGGADVLWIETMSDLNEVRAAVAGARQAAPDLPVVATMTFDTRGFTMMGVSPADAVAALSELGLAAIGGNCGNGPDEIEGVIHGMRVALGDRGQGIGDRISSGESQLPNFQSPISKLPLIAKSNAGMPHIVDGRAVYSGTPEVMASYARRVRALGADIIGACCGSTPDHIRAMARALRELPALTPEEVELASAPAQRHALGSAQRAREERRARRGA
ncbi:MAG TPA: homocysteine S-methyltransferase family protein [Roseiflexaceae bacterium]|nr:homocysteine S-methyltransferase family protein [Roseiflexaceae bacterium]